MLCRHRYGLLFSLVLLSGLVAAGADTKPSGSVSGADQLYRAGKFAEAEAGYRALLRDDPKQASAQVGLIRALLREQKIDEALDAANAGLSAQPDSAALLAAKGDVQFRLGEMIEAENSYLSSKKLHSNEARAYLGLARLYGMYSLYRQSYDQLQLAHGFAPDDIEVQRAWLGMLPRRERLAALEVYLQGSHPDDEEENQRMREGLDFLKATIDKPAHSCKLVSKVEQTETKLIPVWVDLHTNRFRGISLEVKLNDREARLQLDTGAGGITVGRRLAEKAGLVAIASEHYGGVGDKGLQSGYSAVADHIRIGNLEFRDCVVLVSDKRSIEDEDGLIGADVFGAYVVDIDLPGMRLKLSPLPKLPEDTVTQTALNSEGEEQANVDQKEESATGQLPDQQKTSAPTAKARQRLPRDRYVAPEMANWTKVFRLGHMILIPTLVNDSSALLFGLDTGAFENVLSLRAARQAAGGAYAVDSVRIRGLSGQVNEVYGANATLRFGHLRQPNMGVVTLDLSRLSRQLGTELSGLLGFSMLRVLEIKIDYRDGLVDFEYDPKRIPSHAGR